MLDYPDDFYAVSMDELKELAAQRRLDDTLKTKEMREAEQRKPVVYHKVLYGLVVCACSH